ncbi:MAG: D-alanine--D-alanine ligase family protein [Candidatus Absconditicoccaceae bacterium]
MIEKIGLFFGGMSNENQVSISSAKNIIKNIDTSKYSLVLIYRHLDGNFYKINDTQEISNVKEENKIIDDFKNYFDKALLMTHGKYGEDGILQGILELEKIPYCGCRVLSSALCMDKGVFKTFLQGQNINQTKFISLDTKLLSKKGLETTIENIKKTFELPIYIKPCNSGSSVGITRIGSFDEIKDAIDLASKHDSKIIIEQGITNPHEIEVAVLGNDKLIVSQPGELVLAKDFYDYDDKYNLNEAKINIPANLTQEQIQKIQTLASNIYKLCDCRGFARVDFFVSQGNIYLNEINTLPGFTDISMFPMLMNHMGIGFKELISKIIELGY